MPRKPRFPPEPDTQPDTRRSKTHVHRSGPAPKDARAKSEAPTLPPPSKAPPKSSRARRSEPAGRHSEPARSRPPSRPSHNRAKPGMPAATVDEVTADLSKDPRRERDEDD
jgi:hypothetical protein